jgi:hypothetical protein
MLSLSRNSFEERVRRFTEAFVREGLMSRRKLAYKLDTSERELGQILAGEQAMTPELANHIMNVLGIEPYEIYTPEEMRALFG